MKICQKVLESSVEFQKGDYISCLYISDVTFFDFILTELYSIG